MAGGKAIRRIGECGLSNVQPVGLALDKQGNLYVAVYGDNTVQKYSPTGRLLAIWGTLGNRPDQFDHPVGIAVDSDGSIYVADQGNNRIQKLSPAGIPMASWGSAGNGPGQFLQLGSIAVDTTSNVYITDGSTGLVQQFSATGHVLAVWGQKAQALFSSEPLGLSQSIPRAISMWQVLT